jgi:hypothetical protein
MKHESQRHKLAALALLLLPGCSSEAGVTSNELGIENAALSAQNPADTGVSLTSSYHLVAGFTDCNYLGCDGFAPPAGARPAKRTHGSNSQVALPNNMLFGDFDGDRQADIIQYDDNGRVFAYRADLRKSEISHFFMPDPIDRIIVGDFYGAGWDQVCVSTRLGLNCYGVDATRDDQFRLFFKQTGSPILPSEDIIVGDYDGDKKDQLFLYDRVAGTFRMLVYKPGSGFVQSSTWTKGNLSRVVGTTGLQFRAGDWTGDGRTDLVIKNSFGQVLAYASATGSGGNDTFWWSFDSASNVVGSNDLISMARIDDDAKDDIVVNTSSTGAIAFYQVVYNNGHPPAISMNMGNIPTTANSVLAMAWSHPMRNEPGVENRDDPFLFFNSGSWLRAHEARWDAGNSRFTYWLEYQNVSPNNQTGWVPTAVWNSLFLKCKLSGDTSEPADAIIAPLVQRIRDYFWETTYKSVYLSNAQDSPLGWIQVPYTYAQLKDMATAEGSRTARSQIGRECAKAAGKDPNAFDTITSFVNSTIDWGASGKYATISGENNGRLYDVWDTVQEITHTFGLSQHTGNNDPNYTGGAYGDPWDPMSARTQGYPYTNPLGRPEGPEFTAGMRDLLGAMPARRSYEVPLGAAKQTVYLSAVNRPATANYLQIHLDAVAPNDPLAGYFTVEFREPTGFDRAIPRPTVLVHRVRPNSLQVRLEMDNPDGTFAYWDSAERLAGESYTIPGVATIRVVSLDPVLHLAQVEVSPI